MSNLSKNTIGWQLLVLISLLLIVSVAAGCAAPAPTAEPAEEPVEEAVAEEPAEAPMTAAEAESPFSEGCWDFPDEDVTIEIWWHEYGPFTEYVYELIDRYEEMHPNVNIEPVVASQSDLNQKLTVALASGTGPHILDQDISFYSAYYDKGVLEPINLEAFCADSQAEIEDQYIGSVLEGVTFDGDIYGLPYQTNSMSFFLSSDAFEEVGLDPIADAPKTWDDLKRVGEMLKVVDGGSTIRKGYDFPYQSQRWQLQAFQPMVEQFGDTLLSEDKTECRLNSEAAVNALTLWTEVTGATGDPSVSLATPSHPNQDFIDGRVAIWMTGPWATNQLNESQIEDRWTVTSLPQLDPDNPHTMMYGFTWGVNQDKPELEKLVAWDFIRYMLSNPEEWLQKASFIQPRTGILETETAQEFPFMDVHLKDVETASWYLRSIHTNEIVQIVGRAIERAIFEGVDPQTSLDQAQEECAKVLADAKPEPVAEAPAAEAADPFAEGCWEYPAEDVTIEIWWHEYGPFTEYVYELIDRYEEMHPNVNIEPVVASQSDLNQKLTVALASGTGPDILDQDISFYSAYYDKGVLEPINLEAFCADSQAEIEDQYIGTVLEGVTFDGDIYGLPYQTNSMSYFLSSDAFEEVGLDPIADAPKTWDDLKRVGEMLKVVDGGSTIRKGYDFPYQSQRWQLQAFQPMVEQFGDTLLSEDGTECRLNSEAAVNALTLWTEVTAVTGDPSVSLATPSHPNQDFIDGRVAIWMTGPWATNQLNESQIEDRWTVTSLPQLDPDNPHTMMYGFTWGVNQDKPDINKLVAWDFIRYMLSNPEEWLQKASFIQPRTGILETETAQEFPFMDVHLKDVETASWYLRSIHTNEIVQIVGRAIERAIFEGVDPQTSLDQAQEECTKVLAQ